MTIDEFFGENAEAKQLFNGVQAMANRLGAVEMRVTKSQIAFRRRRAFAWVWMPGQYLKGNRRRPLAPLVLTLSLSRRDGSPRWKEIVEPAPEKFMHHLELYSGSDLDEEVQRWLQEAWESAG